MGWDWDGVRFEFLHPLDASPSPRAKPNTLSCVLRVQAQGGTVLLTGDIDTMVRLASAAPEIRTVTVGGVHHKPGRLPRSRYVFLSPAEEARLLALAASGVTVVAQDVPQAAATPLEVMLRGEGPT